MPKAVADFTPVSSLHNLLPRMGRPTRTRITKSPIEIAWEKRARVLARGNAISHEARLLSKKLPRVAHLPWGAAVRDFVMMRQEAAAQAKQFPGLAWNSQAITAACRHAERFAMRQERKRKRLNRKVRALDKRAELYWDRVAHYEDLIAKGRPRSQQDTSIMLRLITERADEAHDPAVFAALKSVTAYLGKRAGMQNRTVRKRG